MKFKTPLLSSSTTVVLEDRKLRALEDPNPIATTPFRIRRGRRVARTRSLP